MFLRFVCETSALLRNILECDTLSNFLLNENSSTCFLGSGIKVVSHWNAQLLILFKSSLPSFAEALIPWSTEKRDMSSVNSLTIKVKLLLKSFI